MSPKPTMTDLYLNWTGVYDEQLNQWQVNYLQAQMRLFFQTISTWKDIWFSHKTMVYHFYIDQADHQSLIVDFYPNDPQLDRWYEQIAIGTKIKLTINQDWSNQSIQLDLIRLYNYQYLLYLLREIDWQHREFFLYRNAKFYFNDDLNIQIVIPGHQDFIIKIDAKFDLSRADEISLLDQVARGVDIIANQIKDTPPIRFDQDLYYDVQKFIRALGPHPKDQNYTEKTKIE